MQEWFKIKGYYHLTAQSSREDYKRLSSIIKNKKFIATYSFYPLLHQVIMVRRYKKEDGKRCHSYYDQRIQRVKKTVKERPIHFATHLDSLIFSYYANLLLKKYNKLIAGTEVYNSVTAYRKIPIDANDPKSKNKGSIHFAKEVFDEVNLRTLKDKQCTVLTFDIESFFSSLDHNLLNRAWADLLDLDELPADHHNVFKAVTNYSFIYKNDLRTKNRRNFDEKHLGINRTRHGVKAFFASPKEFREAVKHGKLRVYKNQSKHKETNKVMGIPQGLPISAILANLYLLKFDQEVLEVLVKRQDCYYRRYSDDIAIICKVEQEESIKRFVFDTIKKYKLEINELKTDVFNFRFTDGRVQVYKNVNGVLEINKPLIYLGFEYYGYKTLIKSSNLSKFYRRMIYSVKSKSKLAFKIAELNDKKPVLFIPQLKRLYRANDLNQVYKHRRFYSLEKTGIDRFRLKFSPMTTKSGNYFSYIDRAAQILEAPEINKQLKGEKRIFNQALKKHFFDELNKRSNSI